MSATLPAWVVDPRTLLSALVAVATLLLFVQRRIHRRPHVGSLPWVVFGLAAAIWVPELWRDYLTAAAAALLLLIGSGSIMAMVIAGLVAYGLAWLVPGGASVLILFILVISAFFVFRSALRHLRAMERTRTLRPGEHPAGLIQLGGQLGVDRTTPLPGPPLPHDAAESREHTHVACWRLSVGGQTFYSPALLRLVGDHGHALVDPKGLLFDTPHTAELSDDDADQAARDVGVIRGDESVSLRWIENDEAGYVRGLPEWQADRQGAGYRDSSLVPLFRCEGAEEQEASPADERVKEDPIEGPQLRPSIPCVEHPHVSEDRRQLYLANSPLEKLLSSARYSLWAWSVWGAVCATIVVVQILTD